MKTEALGHIVLRVRDLERAEKFYNGLLGIPISVRAPQWSMTFFTLGEHHDLAISEVAADAPGAPEGAAGLDHLAFRLAGGLDALRAAKAELEAAGVEVGCIDHTVTQSVYFLDPDGNRVELYVNGAADWREDPALITSEARALRL